MSINRGVISSSIDRKLSKKGLKRKGAARPRKEREREREREKEDEEREEEKKEMDGCNYL